MRRIFFLASILVATAALGGCGDDEGSGGSGGSGAGGGGGGAGGEAPGEDPQTPPAGPASAVEAWLGNGHYEQWNCEAAVHGPIDISPHGMQRICSNDKVSGHAGPGEYPVGSAGVKELYDAAGANIVGYAVYVHTKAGTMGDTWYWYEKVPLDHPAPHDENGIVADGLGNSGPAKDICVSCHSAAGIDADHPGHDFVYTQVQ